VPRHPESRYAQYVYVADQLRLASENSTTTTPARAGVSFFTFTPQMCNDSRQGPRQDGRMDDFTDDDLFLDAVDTIVLDVLQRLGDDRDARFAFLRRLLDVARDAVGESGRRVTGPLDARRSSPAR